jgi:hypothetical protein
MFDVMVHCHDDLATNVMFAFSSSMIIRGLCYWLLSSFGATDILDSRCFCDVGGKTTTLYMTSHDVFAICNILFALSHVQ